MRILSRLFIFRNSVLIRKNTIILHYIHQYLKPFREIIAVYSDNLTKPIKGKMIIVKAGDEYTYHETLKLLL